MAFARDSYTASAAQTDFTITFSYLNEADVLVYRNGTLAGNDADADTSSYQIVSTSTVRFGAGLTSGDTVVIQRSTSQTSRLVDYATASTLTEADLDNDSLQAFYMAQESIDIANTALPLGSDDNWDATSKLIKNVTDPTAAQDAATKAYVDTVLTTLGNIPVPSASKDLLVATGSSAGDYAWATALDTATQIANDLVDSQHIAAGALDNEHYAINSIDGTHIALGSDAQGDVMYYDGTNWVRLAAGTAKQYLKTQGAGANPAWIFPADEWTLHGTVTITADGQEFASDFPTLSTLQEIWLYYTGLSDNNTSYAELRATTNGSPVISMANDQADNQSGVIADTYNTAAAATWRGYVHLWRTPEAGVWVGQCHVSTSGANGTTGHIMIDASDDQTGLNFSWSANGAEVMDAGTMKGYYR